MVPAPDKDGEKKVVIHELSSKIDDDSKKKPQPAPLDAKNR
jgi:hypothetical protein